MQNSVKQTETMPYLILTEYNYVVMMEPYVLAQEHLHTTAYINSYQISEN